MEEKANEMETAFYNLERAIDRCKALANDEGAETLSHDRIQDAITGLELIEFVVDSQRKDHYIATWSEGCEDSFNVIIVPIGVVTRERAWEIMKELNPNPNSWDWEYNVTDVPADIYYDYVDLGLLQRALSSLNGYCSRNEFPSGAKEELEHRISELMDKLNIFPCYFVRLQF